MATEALKLTAQIVISHASMSELTPKELVDEIKDIFNVLNLLKPLRPCWRPPAGLPNRDRRRKS